MNGNPAMREVREEARSAAILRVLASRQFRIYFAFGALGMAIDAAVLFLGTRLGLDPYSARVISFFVSVTAIWPLHRTVTFPGARTSGLFAQWLRFVVTNLAGGAVNYATFAILVSQVEFFRTYPVCAVPFGAALGLVFNFTAAKVWVFSK